MDGAAVSRILRLIYTQLNPEGVYHWRSGEGSSLPVVLDDVLRLPIRPGARLGAGLLDRRRVSRQGPLAVTVNQSPSLRATVS